ncbi:MAG TPA: amidase [Solirubrobacteraceae bacterium]|nr:amidase [Solirubrobacteraceae bacterium]
MTFLGLTDAAEQLASGEASSRELVAVALRRIDGSQATLNAFRCVRAEAALAEASEADRRRAAGDRLPLLGVPIAIKDDVDLEGETTAFGCLGEFPVATEDSESVRRVRAAGAVIVGKTTTPELGQWPIAESAVSGVTRNPWHLDHTPGGSSGGSAAAVAAGLVPAALGSDGLGSVRVPAAWTHLVGIKPQRGRISTWPEPEAFNGLTCIGPLARTVADAATLLDAARGNHPGDIHQPRTPAGAYADAARAGAQSGSRPLRIALALKPPFTAVPTRLHVEIKAAVERIATVLGDLGHRVEPAQPRYGLFGVGVLARSLGGLHAWSQRLPDVALLDPRTQHNLKVGRLLGGPVLRAARGLEGPMRRQLGAIFRRFDVVLTPTTAQPALAIGALDGLSDWQTDQAITAACPYTWPLNVTGWPGISVPAGLTGGGLPIGAQLWGPANSEAQLIELAAQLETVERWHERQPPHAVAVAGAAA